MDNQEGLRRLNRSTKDIIFFGPKSSGKNILVSYLAAREYKNHGTPVFANYHLSGFPSTYIDSLDHLLDLTNGVLILDDAEQWLDARTHKKEKTILLSQIILQMGKRNVSVWAIGKRFMNIDVRLRNTSMYFIEVSLKLGQKTDDPEKKRYYEQFLNYLFIEANVYDYEGIYHHTEYLTNLPLWVDLFDTFEEIKAV